MCDEHNSRIVIIIIIIDKWMGSLARWEGAYLILLFFIVILLIITIECSKFSIVHYNLCTENVAG